MDYSKCVGWWVCTQHGKFVACARTMTELVQVVSARGGAEDVTIVFVERVESGEPS